MSGSSIRLPANQNGLSLGASDFKDARSSKRDSAPAMAGGSDGGGTSDMERRVAVLEKTFEKIDDKLNAIVKSVADSRIENERRFGTIDARLVAIEKTLESKASTADFRELSGKVSSIPNTWQTLAIMGGLLVGVGGLAFTIAKLSGH